LFVYKSFVVKLPVTDDVTGVLPHHDFLTSQQDAAVR